MNKTVDQDDRQVTTKILNFSINATEKYDVKDSITCIREATSLITNAIIDSYNRDIEGKYDLESIQHIKVDLSQMHNTYIKLELYIKTWETKNEMYNRRAYNKRQRQLKEEELAREAKKLGFKLEKVDD